MFATLAVGIAVAALPDLADAAPAENTPPSAAASDSTGRVKSGRGLVATSGALLGLGILGRGALEIFWVGPAKLEAREPFGQWSIPTIAFATSFGNALVVPGLVMMPFGTRRLGAWRVHTSRVLADEARARRNHVLGWGLLGGGLGLWALTRSIALPVLRRCETNGCAYGYLETTYWLSLGAAIPGAVLVGLSAGERRAKRPLSVMPVVDGHMRGLAVGGRF